MNELAADGIPVAVTCRVEKLAHQPYRKWLANPVTESELVQAYRANALLDAHRDDPEFGYWSLADEAADAGEVMAERTVLRIFSTNGCFSTFGKKPKRSKSRKVGPPVHDDNVQRDFTATRAKDLWLADISEHRTLEGKVYFCAIKDVFSNCIAGYSINSQIKSASRDECVGERRSMACGDVAGCVPHTDRGSQLRRGLC